ncbi:MAG: hypothetical protein ABL985_08305 [Casimicrobium sp.]
MSRRGVLVIAVVAIGLGLASTRSSPPSHTTSSVAPSDTRLSQQTNVARVAGGVVSLRQVATPLANLMPDVLASPVHKIRNLTAHGDPFAAQMLAVRSGDPLLVAHSIYMNFYCMDMPVQLHGKSVRQLLTETSFDPKTGKRVPLDEKLIAMNEAMQAVAPMRIQPPSEIAAVVAKQMQKLLDGDSLDYAQQTELLKKMAAPLSTSQRASFNATIERSVAECRGRLFGAEFGAEYRAALDRLVANGVVSAHLFNRRAGWESPSYSQLNQRDYDLVLRAFAEWQPDGIARLLIGSPAAVGALDSSWMTEENLGAALALEFNLGIIVACALGVSDCGPNSSRFRSMCAMAGGCDQPDLASLLRHVFERDGLEPAVIDREINRVVDAYRRRDLDALGIRRKQ